MAVITDVDSNSREGSFEGGIAQIAGPEIKLFPESGIDMRNVIFTVLAQIFSVGVDYSRSVVIDAGDFFLINRHDDYHAMMLGDFLHQPNSWTIRDLLHRFIPTCLLFSAKVGGCEDFLHTKNLHTLVGRLLDEAQVFLDVTLFNILNRSIG